MTFLCDTNIISEAMKPIPLSPVRRWLDKQQPVFISAITVEEIYFGLHHRDAHKKLAWFEDFIQTRCHILPVTTQISKQCGIWRGQFRKQGINRSQADLLIAATAEVHGLILATRNIRDFSECGVPLFNPFTDDQESNA